MVAQGDGGFDPLPSPDVAGPVVRHEHSSGAEVMPTICLPEARANRWTKCCARRSVSGRVLEGGRRICTTLNRSYNDS
jgi:hypothetical protein